MNRITGPQAAEMIKRMLEDGEVETLEEAICVVFEVSDAINRAIDAGVPEKKIKSILRNYVMPLS
jgi:hypothetical protein